MTTPEYSPNMVKVIKTGRPTFYIDANVYPDVWSAAIEILGTGQGRATVPYMHLVDAEGFKLGPNNQRTGERLDPPTTT